MKVTLETVSFGDRVVYKPNALCADVGRVECIVEGAIGVRYEWGLRWFKPEELITPWW